MSAAAAAAITVLLVVLLVGPMRRPASRGPHRSRLVAARGAPGRPHADRATRMVLVAALIVGAVLIGGVVLGALAGLVAAGAARTSRLLRQRRSRAAIETALPDLVELFLVSASSGQPVAGSLAVVAARAPPAVAGPVAAADRRFRHGLPLAQTLTDLGQELGGAGVQLADALRQAASAGVPLVPLLEGVAATVRDQRRRRAQEAARRLPVTMLFPLVACILPAAVLLSVVPVLVVSVASLRT